MHFLSASDFFVFFHPSLGNSIEQVASTLWSPNQQWVSRSPPHGERSSTGSRTTTERTSRTLPSIWRRLPTCSYALVKGRVMEWTSSESSYFPPPWVKKNKKTNKNPELFLSEFTQCIVVNENAFKDCAVNVRRYHAGKDGAKRQRVGELLPEPEWGRSTDRCHRYMVMTSFKQAFTFTIGTCTWVYLLKHNEEQEGEEDWWVGPWLSQVSVTMGKSRWVGLVAEVPEAQIKRRHELSTLEKHESNARRTCTTCGRQNNLAVSVQETEAFILPLIASVCCRCVWSASAQATRTTTPSDSSAPPKHTQAPVHHPKVTKSKLNIFIYFQRRLVGLTSGSTPVTTDGRGELTINEHEQQRWLPLALTSVKLVSIGNFCCTFSAILVPPAHYQLYQYIHLDFYRQIQHFYVLYKTLLSLVLTLSSSSPCQVLPIRHRVPGGG